MEIKIIIGIPTFNRPQILLRRLNELEKYSHLIEGVIISDNSDVFNNEVNEICMLHENWVYSKNKFNIGGGANFIRLFELAPNGSHLWLRGDDDPITENQIKALFSTNFKANELIILRPKNLVCYKGIGLKDFCENFNQIQSFGWISMCVIPIEIANETLPTGYWGVHTGWAHVCLILGIFQKYNNLSFQVIGFEMLKTDFREVEKEDIHWGFFNTCIKNFSKTSNILVDKNIRQIYLNSWIDSQSYSSSIKAMIGIRIGINPPESIKWETLSPILSLQKPNKIPLFFILYMLAIIPDFLILSSLLFVKKTIDNEKLETLQLGFLKNKTFRESYRILNKKIKREKSIGFI